MVLAEVALPPSILVAGSPVEAAELIVLLFQQFRAQHSGTPFNVVRVGKYRFTSLTWRMFFSNVFTSTISVAQTGATAFPVVAAFTTVGIANPGECYRRFDG
jgi:hypothetical protein